MRLSLEALRFPVGSRLRIKPLSTYDAASSAPKVLTKPETMDFRTLMPERGGLFDPRLFGPGTVIDAPLPGPTELVPFRKTMFARIPLALPMVHPLFVQHSAAGVGALAGKTADEVIRAATEVEAARALVAALEPTQPDLIVRDVLVLPPDLRALRRDEHDRWLATPLNTWYQRVLTRNQRLERLLASGADAAALDPEYAELFKTIRGLAENDEQPDPARDAAGEPLPSVRTMSGGTAALHTALEDVLARGPAKSPTEPVPGRLYVAHAVLFALGFSLEQEPE